MPYTMNIEANFEKKKSSLVIFQNHRGINYRHMKNKTFRGNGSCMSYGKQILHSTRKKSHIHRRMDPKMDKIVPSFGNALSP